MLITFPFSYLTPESFEILSSWLPECNAKFGLLKPELKVRGNFNLLKTSSDFYPNRKIALVNRVGWARDGESSLLLMQYLPCIDVALLQNGSLEGDWSINVLSSWIVNPLAYLWQKSLECAMQMSRKCRARQSVMDWLYLERIAETSRRVVVSLFFAHCSQRGMTFFTSTPPFVCDDEKWQEVLLWKSKTESFLPPRYVKM